ncbi:MAG: STAS domain-containing protein [Chthoniobacteraceae bacterium]
MARKSSKSSPTPRLDGALDIQRVIERRDQLLALTTGTTQPFVVDLSGIASCDTAGLQLLCAARRSATLNGREWRPQQPSEAVLRACTEVGIQPEQLGL